MLSIDEAIAQEREIAEKNRRAMNFESEDNIDDDIKVNFLNCATKHEQFAEWLEELKSIREMDLSIPQHFTKEQSNWIKAYCIKRNIEFYNKALDDFTEKIINSIDGEFMYQFKYFPAITMREIAERLKVGKENEN